jgi:hypothetical protein
MTARNLSDGGAGGTVLGQSATDLIGFWGTTPVVRQAVTCIATGCTSAGLVTKLNLLLVALKTSGVIT